MSICTYVTNFLGCTNAAVAFCWFNGLIIATLADYIETCFILGEKKLNSDPEFRDIEVFKDLALVYMMINVNCMF